MTLNLSNSHKSVAPSRRPRLLMVAFGCDPTRSMEARIGWRRALLAAEFCDVTVLCGPGRSSEELNRLAAEQRGTDDGLSFVKIDHDRWSNLLIDRTSTFYLGYRGWQKIAMRQAELMHAEQPFQLTHQVTYCGYREPGFVWKLPVPFVWGPIGGTQDFPLRFLSLVSPIAGSREVLRSAVNWWQLRFSPSVKQAAAAAQSLTAATTTCQQDLQRVRGIEAPVELETGLDCSISPPRPKRDPSQPLRVLWAGRLQPWKGFPLLIKALQQLNRTSPETKVEVRVLGSGPCGASWRRLAKRRGVGHLIEWRPWPKYHQTLPHYRWADVFAFTSLRDTSGTGLIESLAAGAVIVGLDHQGAADIMTNECAVPIEVTTPKLASKDLAAALADLAADSDRLNELSLNAQARAAAYDWNLRAERTRLVYSAALGESLGALHLAGRASDSAASNEQSPYKQALPLEPIGSAAL